MNRTIYPDPSPEEAAKALGVSKVTVYALMARGKLDSYKLGRLRRIKRRSLLALMGREEVEAAD